MPLLPVLARMELAGIRIDLEALEAMREEFAATLAGLEARIYELVGHEFNIGSPRSSRQSSSTSSSFRRRSARGRAARRMHRSSRSCASGTRSSA